MNPIVDENYGDFLIEYTGKGSQLPDISGMTIEPYNNLYGILHIPLEEVEEMSFLGYDAIPAWYSPMGIGELSDIGVLQVRQQPFLQLRGKGVLFALADGGIDYRREEFRHEDGSSRVRLIWDQRVEGERPPTGLYYGTVYTKDQIDEALRSENPLEMVPVTDPDGHGSYLAGIAAGRDNSPVDSGVAPEADLVVVCLKPMKQYLRKYYELPEDAVLYQETDLMNALRFLKGVAWWYDMPISILMGVGSSLGAHIGVGILEDILNQAASSVGTVLHFPAGNEGNVAHHAYFWLNELDFSYEMELQVGEGEEGLYFEIWGENPYNYRLAVTSPMGEEVSVPFVFRIMETVESFLLNDTVLRITQYPITVLVGKPVITIAMEKPAAGIWRFEVIGSGAGAFHAWLPVKGLLQEDTIFLSPAPYQVITAPGNVQNVVTVAGYETTSGGILPNSGRGYTADNRVKPDLAAPGGIVGGSISPGESVRLIGTSTAAAFTAGASALLLEWAIVKGNNPRLTGIGVRNQLIRGAGREMGDRYPNQEEGYGKLDIYNAIRSLR